MSASMSDGTLNDRILSMLAAPWSDVDVDSLVILLTEYKEQAQKEVDGARGQRNLAIHNTTRAIYEEQIALIEEIGEALDESDGDQLQVLFNKLEESMDSGEAIA